MVWEVKDYSDLEVVVDQTQTWDSNDKMPVLVDTSEEKIAHVNEQHEHHHNGKNAALLSPSVADPVPAYPTSLHSRSSTFTTTPLTKGGDYTEYGQQQDGAESTRAPEKRIWGMSTRQLSLIAAGLLGFLLMLLATVLAITLSMHDGKSSGRVSETSNGSSLLNSSSLAALNWTDTTGLERSMVFYQDAENSILVSIRDSVSNEWSITNISQAVMNNTGAKRLDVLPGTPLAAVTNYWQVSLYYLTSSNYVSEIWSSDVAAGSWFAGSLSSELTPVAMNGSRLSAYWQICTNCTNSLVVLHQQEDGNLMLANFTNSVWELSGPVSSTAVDQTGLSIRPVAGGNSSTPLGLEPSGWKVYEFDSTGMVEIANGAGTNYTWTTDFSGEFSPPPPLLLLLLLLHLLLLGANSLPLPANDASLMSTNSSPEIAAITFGDHGWTNSLVTCLTSNGTLTSYIRNGTAWTSGQPTIEASSKASASGDLPTFTAIAATQDMKMYGITNGTIYEYDVDEDNPLIWTSTGMVFSSSYDNNQSKS